MGSMQSCAEPQESEYIAGTADNKQAWVAAKVIVRHLNGRLQNHS